MGLKPATMAASYTSETLRNIDDIRKSVMALYRINGGAIDSSAADISTQIKAPVPQSTTFTTVSAPAALIPVLDLERSAIPDRPPAVEKRIDQIADDLGQLLTTASNLRQQYGDLAKLFLDTRLKSEEFFRLDDIHRTEVASHLYEIPYWEAENTRSATDAALKTAQAQLAAIVSLEGGDLAQAELDKYVANNKELAALPSTQNQDAIRANAEAATIHRNKLEVASWEYSRRSSEVSVNQLTGQLATAEKKAEYFKKDIVFRTKRAATSRGLAYTQLAENTRPGSILNYAERLSFVSAQYSQVSMVLLDRALRLLTSLPAVYSVSIPSLDVKTASLDDIALWFFKVQRALSDYKRNERIGIFTVRLGRKVSHLQSSLKQATDVTFNVEAKDVGGAKGLLKAVAFELVGGTYPISLLLTPPDASFVSPAPTIVVGRVAKVVGDPSPQTADLLTNADPKGDWRIKLSSDTRVADFDDLLMHLWVSYQ